MAGLIRVLGIGGSLVVLTVKKGFTVNYILYCLSSSQSQGSELDSLPLKSCALTLDIAPVEIMELMQKLLGEVFWTELYRMTRLDDAKCPFGS